MARRSSQARKNDTRRSDGHISASSRTTFADLTKRKEPRPMGRPTALTDRVADTIVQNLLMGNSVEASVRLAGVQPGTYYRWLNRGEIARETLDETGTLPEAEQRFLDFREACFDARAQAEARAVKVVMSAMHGGFVTQEEPLLNLEGQPLRDDDGKILYKRSYTAPDGRLALAYLARARPADWNVRAAVDAKVQVTGEGGGPVEVTHTVEQVSNLHQRLLEVRAEFEQENERLAQENAAIEARGQMIDGEVVGDDGE